MECPNSCGEIIVQEEVGGSILIDTSKLLYFFYVICFAQSKMCIKILFELSFFGGNREKY